jgi:hypothetical protein
MTADTASSIDRRVCRAAIAQLEELGPHFQERIAAHRAADATMADLQPLLDQAACIACQLDDERAALRHLGGHQ